MNIAARTAILGSILVSMGTACGNEATTPSASGGSSSSNAGGSTGSSTSNSSSGGNSNTSQGSGSSTSTSTPSCPTFSTTSAGDIKFSADAASNYSFHSKLDITTSSVDEAVAKKGKLEFDWSAVTKDMYGRTIDPKADIGGILVTIWNYPKADLETKINNDSLITGDRKGAGYLFTQGSMSSVVEEALTSDGKEPLTSSTIETYFNASEFPADKNTFLVMIQKNGKEPGKDGRMLTTFTLSTDSSAAKKITLDNSSTKLEYGADFGKLKPLLVPAGNAKVTIDWDGMTKNAMQNDSDPYKITKVLVASYDQPISELQKNEKFIELETIAVKKFVSNPDDITSTKLSLSKLADSDGNAFSGIDSNHTWILALMCETCLNPAPWYITVLQTCNK